MKAPDIMHRPADMTDAEIEASVEWFSTLTLRELRRRQDLVNQQLKMAYDQGNSRALNNLRAMETQLAAGVGRWLDKRQGNETPRSAVDNLAEVNAAHCAEHTAFEPTCEACTEARTAAWYAADCPPGE